MSFLGTRNAVAIGVSQHLTLGGPDLLSKLSPSLILQFAGAQTMDPRITFTRSTTATFTGSNGLIQTAAINAPRFDYNPVTRAPLGLLVEEQRTNLFVRSDDFGSASWVTVRAALTSDTIVAPNGTLTGDKLIASTDASTNHFVRQEVAVTSGTTYTQTLYAKAAEYTQILLGFGADNSTFVEGAVIFTLTGNGTAGTPSASITSSSITSVGNGWYRCQVSATATATATSVFRIQSATGNTNTFTGNGTSGIFIWGAQLEAGAFPTSYIPTVASQVTRAADVAVMTGTNFSDWYNQAEGTFFGEASVMPAAYASGVLLDVGAGGAFGTTAYLGWFGTGWGLNPSAAPVNMFSTVAGTSDAKSAAALAANNAVIAANGLIGSVDTSCAMPVSATTLSIGKGGWSGSANYFNGHIRKIAYYPRRLSNAALQGITS